MRVVMFYQSLISCWNHGNAHFLRGVATELISRGHQVRIYEPHDSWSVENLLREYGARPVQEFQQAYPLLSSTRYHLATLDLDRALEGADLVLVHEWNDASLVARVGTHRARSRSYRLLFHDTHHRAVTQPHAMAAYDLQHYDGVLAFGGVIRDLYLQRSWTQRAWTWHEAADVRVFQPLPGAQITGDLIWVGNWGDDERTAELHEFLLQPIRELELRAHIFGVRYPRRARQSLREVRARYRGWLPNYQVPRAFSHFKVTVHVPRRPYVRALPGIPTIRPFEALACGIPLVSAPWEDAEGLFEPGRDFLMARDGRQMTHHLRALLADEELRRHFALQGRRRILQRHTCAHRVDELLTILAELNTGTWSSASNPDRPGRWATA